MHRILVAGLFLVIAAVASMASDAARSADVAAAPEAVRTPAAASPSPSARALYVAPAAPEQPAARDDAWTFHQRPKIRGLLVPIAGHAIPTDPILLPDSERAYRAGAHEGIDFAAPTGTAVLAAADGVIVRIDEQYTEAPLGARNALLAAALKLGYTPAATLDMVRGRQAWIDHGRGVVTRYCHLSSVEPFPVGALVRAGERIGAVGASGLPENGPHLHFEVRIGDDFLGQGLSGAELAKIVDLAFR